MLLVSWLKGGIELIESQCSVLCSTVVVAATAVAVVVAAVTMPVVVGAATTAATVAAGATVGPTTVGTVGQATHQLLTRPGLLGARPGLLGDARGP